MEPIENNQSENPEQKDNRFRLRNVINDQDALFLREKSEPVIFDENNCLDQDTLDLITALQDYINDNNGLGMAAIQLGVKKRILVMRKPWCTDQLVTMINPKLLRGSGKSTKPEGCFSIILPDGIGARVTRQTDIVIEYTDIHGTVHKNEWLIGMDARIFLHEFDHFQGIFMIDKPKFKGFQQL